MEKNEMVRWVTQASRTMEAGCVVRRAGIRARDGLDSFELSCTGHRYEHIFGLRFFIVSSFEGWQIMSTACYMEGTSASQSALLSQ